MCTSPLLPRTALLTLYFSDCPLSLHSLLLHLQLPEALRRVEETHPVEGPEKKITHEEIETAIKKTKNSKAPEPSGMTAEMFKALEQDGIKWLHLILNEFMKRERRQQDLKESEIMALYKQTGDVMHCEE